MTIRPATVADARAIAEVHVRAWKVAYADLVPRDVLDALSVDGREAFWNRALHARQSETWVADLDGQVLGWISAGASRDSDATPTTGEVWAIYVDPPHWRGSIGRRLWDVARAHFTRAGCVDATLWVLKENVRALAFYRALGFEVEDGQEKLFERGAARSVEIRLRRSLDAS